MLCFLKKWGIEHLFDQKIGNWPRVWQQVSRQRRILEKKLLAVEYFGGGGFPAATLPPRDQN
jgi:hypothetical protein